VDPSEAELNGPAEKPASGSDQPEASAFPEAPTFPEVPSSPEALSSPEAPAAGPWRAPGYGAPPGAPAWPADPSLIAAAPASRRNAAGIALGAVAVVFIVGVLLFALIKHLDSTSNVRAILPAPAAAGGLNQDYTDESSSQYRSAVSTLDQSFKKTAPGGKFGAAIYTNAPAGSSARGASVVLVYIGVNGSEDADTASTLKSVLSAIGHPLTHASQVQEGSGHGDTRFACETGIAATGAKIVVCAWGTDRSVGILIPEVPINLDPLAALLKKMQPDLVRS
jgi:hypothetical protein